jgi:AGCS family alanine or glycine:cation symporter
MEVFESIIDAIDSFVWSIWLLIPLLAATGIILTVRLTGLQFTKLGAALKLALVRRKDPGAEGDISHYQALTTALAATVGTGNIVGVATAIGLGGPGALFWMWVTGILGMASKYSEAFLGSKYREFDSKGEVMGGPQVYLQKAIKGPVGKILGVVFAIFGALAAFGIGNGTQVSSMTGNMEKAFGVPQLVTGLIIMVLVGLTIIGGIKAIGRVTAAFVPFMIVLYILAGIVVLVLNAGAIIPAFGTVFHDAFTGSAVLGAGVGVAIQRGMARGIFSNESGMGSAAIVAAAAKTTHPVRQGLVSMTQTFIDTIVVVTFTGIVIVASDVWTKNDPDAAAGLTSDAFSVHLGSGVGNAIVAICIVFFALSTVIGWSYYGERCAVSLLGIKVQLPYRILFTLMIAVWAFFGSLENAEMVSTTVNVIWNIADILNGLMALPNLIGLIMLSGLIARETKAYLAKDPDLSQGGVEPDSLVAMDFSSGKIVWVPADEKVTKA